MGKWTGQDRKLQDTLHEWFETTLGEQPITEVLRTSENSFVRKYYADCMEYGCGLENRDTAKEQLRRFHRTVSAAAHKARHLFFSLYNLSSGEMPAKAGVLEELPDFFDGETSYSDLFDSVTDVVNGPDLFSPAAYFADLLRIIETYITADFDIPKGHRLRDRRPDLYTRLLSKENTETLLPYTDIIRERLTAALQKLEPETFGEDGCDSKIKAYCAGHVYPFSLPFSAPYHTVAAALTKNGFYPARLLTIFKANLPEDHLTAAAYGISVDYLKKLRDCGRDFYPDLPALKEPADVDVKLIMQTTGLPLEELNLLLGRGIESAVEFDLAAPGFYINKDLLTCLDLSENAKTVNGLTADSAANLVRFVRYASLTGLSFDQLDALTEDGGIDTAVSRLASLRSISKDPAALLPLISSLYDYGQASTFKAVYKDSLSFYKEYTFSDALPAIAVNLGVSEHDIQTLCSYLFEPVCSISSVQLNALYRNTYMAGILGIETGEYITLTKLAGLKPGSLKGIFSVQTISSLLSYSDLRSINAYEADYICTGFETSYANSGFTGGDFTRFIDDIKEQTRVLSDEKKKAAVKQGLIDFLGADASLAERIFVLIPAAPSEYASWEETFYKDGGIDFACGTARRLARANMLAGKLPADVFTLFAGELFTDDLTRTIPYQDLVDLCRLAGYYLANPIFFVLAADAIMKKDKAALAALCALAESDVDGLLAPLVWSLSNVLQFMTRLDALKTMNLSLSNLTVYLDGLTKENGYEDLLALAKNLPAPDGLNRTYCSALTALTIQQLSEIYQDITTPDALSAYLLMDVQMEETVKVSYIREGINAALNYLNRCRSGMEPGIGRIHDISDDYWSWIMNFSDWKANRMVFVAPENYLLPDIRTSQSTLFKNALQSVLGKPLDLAAAESLYAKYLDDYAKLSEIVPCASYLASSNDSEQLYIFGRTPSTDGKLYYCIRKDRIWGEWREISASIPTTEITPVFIFGKLFIFWIERQLGAAPEISYTNPAKNGDGDTLPILLQNTPKVFKFSVKYTFRDLLGNWTESQKLFDDECVIENDEVDYGKQFQNTYNTDGEGYKRLVVFRLTERNFCDASGRYYISQNSEYEKLLIMYGGFVYHFPDDTIENYYPLSSPFDTQDKASFSNKHAAICDKINILSKYNISGRLCSGISRIYGSTLREENIVADGEFLIFDEYTGGTKSAVPAVAVDESSSVISSVLTADVLKNTLLPIDKITPKFAGQALPEYAYTGENGDYTGEFSDTLNTYVLGTDPDSTLKVFQAYLQGVNIAQFKEKTSGENETEQSGTVQINPLRLSTTSFYSSTSSTGIAPAQFGDLYAILLQCLGSQNLFGSTKNRLASEAEIIKTANLAGGFILKTGGNGGEIFLLTPVPVQEQGKPAQLRPTDSSIVISYPKITADDIEKAVGDINISKYNIFDALYNNDPPVIDLDGYVYMANASENNIVHALGLLYGENIPQNVEEGLLCLLNNRRLASNYMFWSQNVDRETSKDIFSALTGHPVEGYAILPVDDAKALSTNPKVKLRNTQVIATKTPDEVSSIFNQYVNAPLPVSLRFCSDAARGFDIRTIRYDVTRLTNASLPYITPSFSTGGVSTFLRLENQQTPVPAVFPISRFSPNTDALNLPSALDGAQPDFDGLYKNYNYELFYHIPIYAAMTLRDFGNYSEAKKWMEYIFSPLAAESFISSETLSPVLPEKREACIAALVKTKLIFAAPEKNSAKYRVKNGFCLDDFEKSGARPELEKTGLLPEEIDCVIAILSNYTLGGSYSYCWQFFPFRSRTIADLEHDFEDSAELLNYYNNPFDPHAIASLRIGAYEKYTVLEYAGLLTEWGDSQFARLTWDSIANASSLYNMANDVLGKRPVILNRRIPADDGQCFDDLYTRKEYTHSHKITSLLEKLTLLLMDGRDGDLPNRLCTTTNTEFFFPYFKIPVNDAALAKWDIVADRLDKIRNNLDINGNPRMIPLFPAASDPLALARTKAAGYAPPAARRPAAANNWYRYSVLYAYAKEFTLTLIQFSSQLLSAIEKGDSEALQVLSARQSGELIEYARQMRKNTIDELEKEAEILNLAKTAAQARCDYYDNLVKENLSTTEEAAIGLNIAAGAVNLISSGLAIAGGVLALAPEVGSPFAMVYGGRELSGSMMDYSIGAMSLAASLSSAAGVTDAYAAYARRLEEWKFQKEQAENDVKNIETQLEANELQKNMAVLDQKNTDLIGEQTTELIDFYQTKFSSCNLYSALSGLLRRVVFNSYQTAVELASRAEMAWQEETDDNTSFLTYTYWDDAKCGLLSGETLLSALDTMQAAYISKNPRRSEITKIISLAENCPDAFAQLQKGNACSFTLPLSLFDDEKAPANYLHKIRSITISTQVVIGAYQNVSAKLTQTGSVILTDPMNQEAVKYVAGYEHCGAAVPSGVISNRRLGQSIRISHAQNDSGMHFYDPHSSAYLPFEGTGVVSQWYLEYSKKNIFRPEEISDIVLNIAYTAMP